jgi:nucleotide-binding universal stress UspA family protein
MSVLLCYDGSESAKHAIWAAHATLGHRSLTLLHVWHPPAAVLADAFGAKSPVVGPSAYEFERWAEARAQEVLREGEKLALELGFAVEGRAERSETAAWQTILDVADQIDAKLIVLGTHGTTAVQSGLLGSVSAAVTNHSRRPVLVVPKSQANA